MWHCCYCLKPRLFIDYWSVYPVELTHTHTHTIAAEY